MCEAHTHDTLYQDPTALYKFFKSFYIKNDTIVAVSFQIICYRTWTSDNKMTGIINIDIAWAIKKKVYLFETYKKKLKN